MKYIISDTIRLKATIKNLLGVEEAPAGLTVSVYKLDGAVLLSGGEPSLTDGTTAQYYYDWTISGNFNKWDKRLAVVWKWYGPHRKEMLFNITPPVAGSA
ncbi:unnamed protein product [marine sediment metagenome]|uniref:Uncharacterized protein n=1 Tax=marine sediment metagenome TaxID=412755 RepID=X1UIY2_9ZZZZ